MKNYLSLTFCFAITIIFIGACKKNENRSEINYSAKADIDKIKKSISEKIAEGKTFTILNQTNVPASDVYFTDANNNIIDIQRIFTGPTPDYNAVCDFQYDGNGDPIEDMFPANFNLDNTGFIYDCGSGSNYRVSFKWSLAVHHLIQSQNNFGTGGSIIRSRYNLKIKNSSGTVIATYNTNYLIGENIADLGDWTVDPTRKLYNISASINIPSNIFANGVTYETTLTLATNCNLTPQLSAVHTTTSINSLNNQPCLRTDKVWCNPYLGAGGTISAAGTFLVCSPPYGYTVSANHDLQYRLKTTTGTLDSWDAQTSTIYPSPTTYHTFSTYVGVISLPGTQAGTGTWLIRYRNNNSCSPTAPWFVEKYTP